MTNPYYEAVMKLPISLGISHGVRRFNIPSLHGGEHYEDYRDNLVVEYAWAIPSPDALRAIAQFAPRICEIGAGTGYWAKMLTQEGVSVVAYDKAVPGVDTNDWRHTKAHFNVQKGDETAILNHQDRALMLCWPPYSDEMATKALKAYTGDKLIYIGESMGGCTGDDEFHELREKDFREYDSIRIPQWEGIRDYVYLMERI